MCSQQILSLIWTPGIKFGLKYSFYCHVFLCQSIDPSNSCGMGLDFLDLKQIYQHPPVTLSPSTESQSGFVGRDLQDYLLPAMSVASRQLLMLRNWDKLKLGMWGCGMRCVPKHCFWNCKSSSFPKRTQRSCCLEPEIVFELVQSLILLWEQICIQSPAILYANSLSLR